MNPSYMAYNKALLSTIMNTLMGIEPPEPKSKQLNQTDGKLFASKNGNGDEINNNLQDKMEKEAEVRAHLDKLAAECKQRYLDGLLEIPYVEEIDTWQHRQVRSTEEWVQREMARNRANNFNKYMDDAMTSMLSFDKPEKKFPNLKRDVDLGKHDFPRSDMIVLMEEEQERRELEASSRRVAAIKAAVHTGDNPYA